MSSDNLAFVRRLSTAQVEVAPEGGHLMADPVAEITRTMSWLRDPAGK